MESNWRVFPPFPRKRKAKSWMNSNAFSQYTCFTSWPWRETITQVFFAVRIRRLPGENYIVNTPPAAWKKKFTFFFKAKNWLCKNEKIILDFFLLRCVSLGAFYALSKWPNITTIAGLLRGNCPEQQSYMTVKILSTQKATKNKRAFMVVVVAAFCFILSSDCKD